MNKAKGLEGVVKKNLNPGDKLAIILHTQPDMDAVSSAFLWKYYILGKKFDIPQNKVDILYKEKSSFHRNRELTRRLSEAFGERMVDLRYNYINKLPEKYHLFFFLDVEPEGGNNPVKGLVAYDRSIVIDHHGIPPNETIEDLLYYDIRDEEKDRVSSTASISMEYMEKYGIAMQGNKEKEKSLATALYFAIYIDTHYFKNAKSLDYLALAKLDKHIDKEEWGKLLVGDRDSEAQNIIAKGILSREYISNGKIVFSGLGYQPKERVYVVPQLADELEKESKVRIALAYAIIINGADRINGKDNDGPILKMCIRVDSQPEKHKNAHDIAKLFGGHGKEHEASVELPLEELSFEKQLENKEELFEGIKNFVKEKLNIYCT